MKKAIVIVSAGLLLLLAVGLFLVTRPGPVGQELSQAQVVAMVQSNLVAKLQVHYPPELAQVGGAQVMLHDVRGTFFQADASGDFVMEQGKRKEVAFVAKMQLTEDLEKKFITNTKFAAVTPNPVVEKIGNWIHPQTKKLLHD